MQNLITVKGTTQVDNMEFADIEGGFGHGKKAMLVKDIARIHDKDLRHVNEAINKNRARFKDGVQIIDLKSVDFVDRDFLNTIGFSNSSIANANNIYILSERGYSVLLKILEDDVAWEQYEKLVDGYFNMREVFKTPQTQIEWLEYALEEAKEKQELKQKIEEDKPKVEFADTCLKSKDNILVREMAKIISDNGFKLGERRLYNKLRKWNLVFLNSTEPYQRYIDAGYFAIKQTSANTPYGIKLNRTTLITPKGQQYIINRLKDERKVG